MDGFHLVEPPQDGSHSLIESSDPSRRRDIEHSYPALDTAHNEPTNSLPMTVLVNSGDLVEKGGAPSNRNLTSRVGRVTILTLEILQELVQDKELNFRIHITENELRDKSKADGLLKTIFILQTSWFILHCLVRHFQGLRVTQFELTMGALASLNTITLLLWWEKPLGVRVPLRVYLPRTLTERERNAGVSNISVSVERLDSFFS